MRFPCFAAGGLLQYKTNKNGFSEIGASTLSSDGHLYHKFTIQLTSTDILGIHDDLLLTDSGCLFDLNNGALLTSIDLIQDHRHFQVLKECNQFTIAELNSGRESISKLIFLNLVDMLTKIIELKTMLKLPLLLCRNNVVIDRLGRGLLLPKCCELNVKNFIPPLLNCVALDVLNQCSIDLNCNLRGNCVAAIYSESMNQSKIYIAKDGHLIGRPIAELDGEVSELIYLQLRKCVVLFMVNTNSEAIVNIVELHQGQLTKLNANLVCVAERKCILQLDDRLKSYIILEESLNNAMYHDEFKDESSENIYCASEQTHLESIDKSIHKQLQLIIALVRESENLLNVHLATIKRWFAQNENVKSVNCVYSFWMFGRKCYVLSCAANTHLVCRLFSSYRCPNEKIKFSWSRIPSKDKIVFTPDFEDDALMVNDSLIPPISHSFDPYSFGEEMSPNEFLVLLEICNWMYNQYTISRTDLQSIYNQIGSDCTIFDISSAFKMAFPTKPFHRFNGCVIAFDLSATESIVTITICSRYNGNQVNDVADWLKLTSTTSQLMSLVQAENDGFAKLNKSSLIKSEDISEYLRTTYYVNKACRRLKL
ncbi:hypothetical protein GJ496_001624 [Pomphorhynchus laevis]|nr:hypothetical protein GJ496_001624 [Pomphorhynchus laevis]